MSLEFQVNASLPSNESYCVVDKDLRSTGKARPLGQGNMGVVYRAKYKQLDRAIKFLSPRLEVGGQSALPLDVMETEFEREISLLSTVTHANIVKIVDFDKTTIDNKEYPYYVMEYVAGEPFNKVANECHGRDFLSIVMQVVDALRHLHSMGYYHMDVKEENILVQSPLGAEPHVVLLDLGGAKQVASSSRVQLREHTIYVSTDKATRSERRPMLGKPIERTQLAKWGVDLDFFALGAMINRVLRNKVIRERITEDLTASGLVALDWVVERLTEGTSDDLAAKRHYKSAEQLRSDLSRLLPEYTWPLGLPGLSLVVGTTSIGLPREHIGFTTDLMKVVNHPLFQRLRNVPQLEYVYLIYPGAIHSRFQHVLSTFQLARLFISRLLEYAEFRMLASPEYVQATLLMALLHDIGHYPLSHAFEDFAVDAKGGHNIPNGSIPSEEALFQSIVCPAPKDRFSEAAKRALKQTARGSEVQHLDELIRDLFPRSYDLLPRLMYPERGAPPPVPLLHSLIDSAIDVDKVSYLIEDSLATGVRFGQGIDVHGLLQSLVPPRGEDQEKGAIAVTENGLAAAEALVLSRFWMVSRVYWHRTNRSILAMHKFVIADLIKSDRLQFDGYFEDTMFSSQTEATALLARRYEDMHSDFGRDGQKQARNPLAGLLDARRDIYKRFISISNGPGESDRLLYEKVLAEGPLGIVDIGELIRGHLKDIVPEFEWRYGDVLVDVPHKRRDLLGYNVLVYLDRDPQKGRNLSGGDSPVSPLLRGLTDDFEYNVKKCRVFIPADAMDTLRSLSKTDNARDSVRRYLEDYYDVPPGLSP